MRECDSCGNSNFDDYIFCTKCGKKLPGKEPDISLVPNNIVRCHFCAGIIHKDERYCPTCGHEIRDEDRGGSVGWTLQKIVFFVSWGCAIIAIISALIVMKAGYGELEDAARDDVSSACIERFVEIDMQIPIEIDSNGIFAIR